MTDLETNVTAASMMIWMKANVVATERVMRHIEDRARKINELIERYQSLDEQGQAESPTYTIDRLGYDGEGVIYACWRREGEPAGVGRCYWWEEPWSGSPR